MASNKIFEIVRQKLRERQIYDWDMTSQLITIDPDSKLDYFTNGDLFLLVHFFSDNPVNGKIVSPDNAIRLNATNASSELLKHKLFSRVMQFTNFDSDEDLVCEFLRITPINSK